VLRQWEDMCSSKLETTFVFSFTVSYSTSTTGAIFFTRVLTQLQLSIEVRSKGGSRTRKLCMVETNDDGYGFDGFVAHRAPTPTHRTPAPLLAWRLHRGSQRLKNVNLTINSVRTCVKLMEVCTCVIDMKLAIPLFRIQSAHHHIFLRQAPLLRFVTDDRNALILMIF